MVWYNDWLITFYNFYMAAIVSIIGRRGISIDVHHRNQHNRSKLVMYNLFLNSCRYCILLIIHGENVLHFYGLLHNLKSFLTNFCIWVLWELIKAGKSKTFIGNEGKDVKQQNFTMNNKQYMVSHKTECFSYKGGCGVPRLICIEAFKRRADISYR